MAIEFHNNTSDSQKMRESNETHNETDLVITHEKK